MAVVVCDAAIKVVYNDSVPWSSLLLAAGTAAVSSLLLTPALAVNPPSSDHTEVSIGRPHLRRQIHVVSRMLHGCWRGKKKEEGAEDHSETEKADFTWRAMDGNAVQWRSLNGMQRPTPGFREGEGTEKQFNIGQRFVNTAKNL